MNTKTKGDLAIGQAIGYFMSNNYEVCLPIGDKREYDFVVEKNGLLEKVQVKFAGLYKEGICKVALRVMGGNQSYGYARKYKDDSFDLLFVYSARGKRYLLPWKKVTNRNQIHIEHEKYKKFEIK